MVGRKRVALKNRAALPGSSRGSSEKMSRHMVVIGAGRMGADIALAFVRGGWECDVVDPDAHARERALEYWGNELRRLRSTSRLRYMRLHTALEELAWPSVELVVEAVPEDIDIKHAVLKRVEGLARATTIIATNTSSLRIGDITSVLERPARSAGFHFSVPAHIMLAVEITKGEHSSAGTIKKLIGWTKALDKVPIVVNRDIPGMLINRIQHAMYREIYHLIDSGVATVEDIDRAVRFGFGFRYNIVGPVLSRDIHGLPVHLATARQLYPTLYNGKVPGEVLSRLVEEGHFGVTTGRGFYKWDKKTTTKRLERFAELLGQSLKRIKRVGEPSEF